jgi:2-oxoglutarate ferredoxin oxidoreductase subunit beta
MRELIKYIKKALMHKGFSFIDAISPCYTQYGRRNQKVCGASPASMVLNLKETSVRAKTPEELFTFDDKDKILLGEFSKDVAK